MTTPHAQPKTSTVGFSGVREDALVLGTVNAPYKHAIDATALAHCVETATFGSWLVHVATFFTDVVPDLVLGFAEQHGIDHGTLLDAYWSMKDQTGEENPELEAELVALAHAA